MSATVQRVFYHLVGRPFLSRLVLPLFGLLLGVALLDATTDWGAMRRQLASLLPWQRAMLFALLVLGWSLQAGRALRPLWRQPMIAFLVRQPFSRWQWVVGLLPSLAIAFVPVAAIWWLAPRSANPLIHFLGFVGLAWPMILGASYGRLPSLALLTGTVSLAGLVLAYAYYPFAAYVALVVTIAQLPFGVAAIPRQVAQVRPAVYGDLSGSGVVLTLIRRDLRCLRRTARRSLLNLTALSVLAALMMWAFRVNGNVQGRYALLTAVVLFSFAASAHYDCLEKLKAALGTEVMRRRWPVTDEQRALALAGLLAALLGPSALAVAVLGSTMGGANLSLFALFAVSSVVSSSALFAQLLRTKRSAVGLAYLMTVLHFVIVLVLPGWAYGLFAVAAVVFGFALTRRGLRDFAASMEGDFVARTA